MLFIQRLCLISHLLSVVRAIILDFSSLSVFSKDLMMIFRAVEINNPSECKSTPQSNKLFKLWNCGLQQPTTFDFQLVLHLLESCWVCWGWEAIQSQPSQCWRHCSRWQYWFRVTGWSSPISSTPRTASQSQVCQMISFSEEGTMWWVLQIALLTDKEASLINT